MTFAKRLARAIAASGLKQREVAERAGTSQQVISAILKRNSPRSTYTAQLAKACGVSPDWLATGKGAMRPAAAEERAKYEAMPLPNDAEELARAWMRLSPALQSSTRTLIFYMAAGQTVAPWLRFEVPKNPNYDAWETEIQARYDAEIKQLSLDLDP